MRPIDTVNNKPGRVVREIKVRLLPNSGLAKFRAWIEDQDWTEILNEPSVDLKAETLHKMVLEKLDEFCPEKTRKVSNDDQPWFQNHLEDYTGRKVENTRETDDQADTRNSKKKR